MCIRDREEYCGGYFTGIDGYPDAAAVGRSGRSYSRAEYTGLLQAAGFGGLTFYYPYPDHKFPSVIYSDEWLPQKGELAEGRSNYDRDRVACFNAVSYTHLERARRMHQIGR